MKRTFPRPLLLVFLALLAACAASGAGTGTQVRRDSTRITAEEIEAARASDPFELVQRLRPTWIQGRGPDSIREPGSVVVYLDGVRLGDVESLRQIPIGDVASLQFYSAGEATTKW
ncbi:MAG TPA: hypothetical protein VHG28_14490, partial [Longimicrobiaceae bacterium]|nr:hypothetical protein [Longimicrobiaceae bacterium]